MQVTVQVRQLAPCSPMLERHAAGAYVGAKYTQPPHPLESDQMSL